MLKKFTYLLGNLLALVTAAGLLARYIPPDVWWPPAVIALLLPVMLFGTLLFALWGVWKKAYAAVFLPVIVLLAALPLGGRLFAFSLSNGAPAGEEKTVTILTANVRGFKNSAWQEVNADLRTDFLKKQRPDVLLLQEARAGFAIEEVRAASGLDKRHQPNRKTIATYADNVTFIDDVFTRKGSGFNGFLVTDVETAIGTLRVINVHLQSNRISDIADDIGSDKSLGEGIGRAESMFRRYGSAAATRAHQAEQIRKHVEESPHPVIVAGDFNDVPSSYIYQRIRTDRLRDAWTERGFGVGTTFTGPLPFLRIDFLLVDKSLKIEGLERVETGYSDHRGLRATLSVRR